MLKTVEGDICHPVCSASIPPPYTGAINFMALPLLPQGGPLDPGGLIRVHHLPGVALGSRMGT